MDIKRSGSQPSGIGPAEWFTGTVRVDPLFQAPDPARVAGASVTFEPGARTAWHTHPLGQTLIVTAGCGRAQRWGGPIEEIRSGDVIWIPPGEKHWHGARATTAMTHNTRPGQERNRERTNASRHREAVARKIRAAEESTRRGNHARRHEGLELRRRVRLSRIRRSLGRGLG